MQPSKGRGKNIDVHLETKVLSSGGGVFGHFRLQKNIDLLDLLNTKNSRLTRFSCATLSYKALFSIVPEPFLWKQVGNIGKMNTKFDFPRTERKGI